jgi:hypothetical protein
MAPLLCLGFTELCLANNGPWKKLATRKGLAVKYWHVTPVAGSNNPYAVAHDIATLVPLITSRTRIVAISACSNLLGSVVDVKAAVQAVSPCCPCAGFRVDPCHSGQEEGSRSWCQEGGDFCGLRCVRASSQDGCSRLGC